MVEAWPTIRAQTQALAELLSQQHGTDLPYEDSASYNKRLISMCVVFNDVRLMLD